MKKLTFIFFMTAVILLTQNMEKASANILDKGNESQAVEELQAELNKLGYLQVNPTGYYGALTQQAVEQFQLDFGLHADGVAGPQTQVKLSDVQLKARVVHGEARGETYEGQVAVAAVINNRLHSEEFPGSVEQIIRQTNAFTAVQDGQYNLQPGEQAYQAVRDAQLGWDPSGGAHYYYNPDIATSEWMFNHTTPETTIGKHIFANTP